MRCDICDNEGRGYECIECKKSIGENCLKECAGCEDWYCVSCYEKNPKCTACRNA